MRKLLSTISLAVAGGVAFGMIGTGTASLYTEHDLLPTAQAAQSARSEMTPASFGLDWKVKPKPKPKDRLIEIVEHLPSNWDVAGAEYFIDKYTTSNMRIVRRCTTAAYRCITIKSGGVKGNAMARSENYTIKVDLQKVKRSGKLGAPSLRRWLIAHELGHQFGLNHSTGNNFMWEYNRRYGKYPRMVATGAQMSHLARR